LFISKPSSQGESPFEKSLIFASTIFHWIEFNQYRVETQDLVQLAMLQLLANNERFHLLENPFLSRWIKNVPKINNQFYMKSNLWSEISFHLSKCCSFFNGTIACDGKIDIGGDDSWTVIWFSST
jgi:hypothetical protein